MLIFLPFIFYLVPKQTQRQLLTEVSRKMMTSKYIILIFFIISSTFGIFTNIKKTTTQHQSFLMTLYLPKLKNDLYNIKQ